MVPPASTSLPTPREQTRQRILEGAERAFQEHGLKGTRVQDILNEANVSRRTFYLYFSNIESVLTTLYDLYTNRILLAISDAIGQTQVPLEKMHRAIDEFLAQQHKAGPLLVAMTIEAMRHDSPLAPRRMKTQNQVVAMIDSAVTQHTGVQVDPLVFRALVIGIEGLVNHAFGSRTLQVDEVDRVRSVVLPLIVQILLAARSLPQRPAVD